MTCQSYALTAAACTRTSTSLPAGTGGSTSRSSRTSGEPYRSWTIAFEEAEAVYRSDLGLDGKLSRACQHPDNLWSLHGLHECLVRRGEKAETALIKQRLDLAQARAEI